MSDIVDICAKAKMFASDDVGKAYVILKVVSDWQKENGGTLDELLDYMEKAFAKKEACV